MALNLKNKFSDKKEFTKYFGLAPVRIVCEEDGTPVINPSEETLARHFDNYEPKEEERTYTGKANITSGYTDFKENGGKQRKSKKALEELSIVDQDDYVEEEEIGYTNVTFMIETLGKVNIKKLITFRLFNAPDITRKGDKQKVFNKYGKTSYMTKDGVAPSFFESSEDDLVRPCPMSRSSLDFEALANFLYAYSSLSKKVALLGDIDLEAIFEGDVSSIEDIIVAIHSDIVTEDTEDPLYGAMVLFMVENNNGTRNDDVQGYFDTFERAIVDKKGHYNKECPLINKALGKARIPQTNGKVYSPESKGQFVGHDGIPPRGLKEFKPEYMNGIKAAMNNAPINSAGLGASSPEGKQALEVDDKDYF